MELLETTIDLMQMLGSHPNLVTHTKPTLCHTDLNMGNIFVLEDNPSEISSIIGWQFTQIASLFLQARWPVFFTASQGLPSRTCSTQAT